MQTKLTEVQNTCNTKMEQMHVLLDSDSQRTHITEELTNGLMLEGGDMQEVHLVTFRGTFSKIIRLKKVSEYDQEISQSHTAHQPMAPRYIENTR